MGDRGGRIEVDSVWIHLDADQRPTRITHFDAYAEAAGGSARLSPDRTWPARRPTGRARPGHYAPPTSTCTGM
jgi:hypothetical protein